MPSGATEKLLGSLKLNWFDFVVVAVLLFGLYRGRKRGISAELPDIVQWVVAILVGTMFYRPLGQKIAGYTGFGPTTSFVTAYLTILCSIHFIFSLIRRAIGDRLVKADYFGQLEYYLGMAGGMVRHACFVVILMALINARYVSEAERASIAKVQSDNFGTISFPTFGSIQLAVFAESQSGNWVKKNLSSQLIQPIPPMTRVTADSPAKAKEQILDSILQKPGKS